MSDQYVLRERDMEEIERLAFQHQVWHNETELALSVSGFQSGFKLADLGGGPGFLAQDLKKLCGPQGRVHCVDKSKIFLSYIEEEGKQDPDYKIIPLYGDIVKEIPTVDGKWDGIISRWVLMFLPDPAGIITRIFDSLRPGGTFVSMEYFNFQQIGIWPPSSSFRRIYKAVEELLGRHGGQAGIGSAVPGYMEEAGFLVETVIPVLKSGASGSGLWQWLEMTSKNHQNLVDNGIIKQQDLDRYHEDWRKRSKNKNAFITAPPLMITVGRKPE